MRTVGDCRRSPRGCVWTSFTVCERLCASGPIVVIAGASYGTGSVRDWAAKVAFAGCQSVPADSFERIPHYGLERVQGVVGVNTALEMAYLANGGVLPTVLSRLVTGDAASTGTRRASGGEPRSVPSESPPPGTKSRCGRHRRHGLRMTRLREALGNPARLTSCIRMKKACHGLSVAGLRRASSSGCGQRAMRAGLIRPSSRGGPVLRRVSSRRRWVGLSGSTVKPIWWIAT